MWITRRNECGVRQDPAGSGLLDGLDFFYFISGGVAYGKCV